MTEQNIEIILSAIADLKLELKSELKAGFARVDGELAVIDKRLSLIEQRLSNIEKWVPVDHKELQHQP